MKISIIPNFLQTVPYGDTYGKMPFLEEVIFHGIYPYDQLDEGFNWFRLGLKYYEIKIKKVDWLENFYASRLFRIIFGPFPKNHRIFSHILNVVNWSWILVNFVK